VLLLVLAVVVLVFGLGFRGVRTSIAESVAKYEVAAWLQELGRHTTAFCTQGGAEFARDRANDLCRDYVAARKRHFRIWFRQVCSSLMLQILASTAVLAIGGWLVIDQQLTTGQLVASELIVTAVVANLTKLGDVLKDFYDVCASSDKLGHLIDLPLEPQNGEDMPTGEGMAIGLQQLGCGVPDNPHSLREFDLAVAAGERVALVGTTGGSASYLLDVLFGLRPPSHGHVTLDGLDLRQLRLAPMRDQIALVHGTEIVEGTVLENLRFGRAAIAADAVRDALQAVDLWDEVMKLPQGLSTPLTTRGNPLSSSQASRLMIARAILGRPRLLMLDGALDVLQERVRRQVLSHLFDRRYRWTVLVVTQMPDVIAACDRRVDLDTFGQANPHTEV
jgi:ABC-type bacteriocin/lantibiotic exporter with double-glycine peptidase domain